jgi:inner membrane protein
LFALAPVDSLRTEVDLEDKLDLRYKPEETPITLAAKRSYLGRVYLDWAQYPITQVETLDPPENGYIVHFQDLRFVRLPSLLGGGDRGRALGAGIQLDRNLHVLGDVYGSGANRVTVPEPGQPGKIAPKQEARN